MEGENLYKKLSEKIGTPSERIDKLWEVLCNEEEARLLLAMPGTAEELAEKTERKPEEVQPMIDLLFRKVGKFDGGLFCFDIFFFEYLFELIFCF